MATDSAKYGLNAVDDLQREWGNLLLKVRCPSHLLHDMVEFVVNLKADDLKQVQISYLEFNPSPCRAFLFFIF
jgi:hypothetical protein